MEYEDDGPNIDMEEQNANKDRIIKVLRSFGIEISSIKASVGPKKNKQVIVDQTCSAVFTFNDGKFFSDHDARLVEVSTQGALIISKHDIDVNALHHIESVVNGGQGQMIPLAGEVNCSKRLNGKTCYFLKFHGYNSQAQRYINIHSAKSTGRRKIPSSKGEKR